MGKDGEADDRRDAARRPDLTAGTNPLLFLFLFLLAGCNLPRIVVLHDPLEAEEHLRLGAAYEAEGKWDLALDQYRQAKEKGTRSRADAAIGNALAQKGDLREAEGALRRALANDPDNGRIENNLASVLAAGGKNLPEAELLARRAIEHDPKGAAYYLDTLAAILLLESRLSEALAALEGAEALAETMHPRDPRLSASLGESRRRAESIAERK